MKSPLLPLRGNIDSAGLLDRGGRPTVRELLGGLGFDALTGALRLNGERVTLQLAEADRILRRELIRLLGEEEARILLLRRGFQMGQNDAAYVARSWPALDKGDAFTAGTRLHMFSGIVRVETKFNDFDFARGRFSAEFLWHNSIEAEDGPGQPRHSDRPVCWQQLGYASGYASFFFGVPVIYKETECVAQGHRCCRVLGRLATGWGEDDPDVILFRSRILPRVPGAGVGGATPAPTHDAADMPLVAPLLRWLERAAQLPLPCLIAGAGSCGQDVAAAQLVRLSGRGEPPLRLAGAIAGPEALQAALALQRKPRRKELPPVLLLDGIEAMPAAAQAELAAEVGGDPQTRPHVVATSALPLARLAAGGILPSLWLRFAPLSVDMPALADRSAELPQLAKLRLARLAAQLQLAPPVIAPGALDQLAESIPETGLEGLDAVLTAILVDAQDGHPLTANSVAQAMRRVAPRPTVPTADDMDVRIAASLARGGFSLTAHEARIRATALAQAGGNLAAAARLLGISRAQLAYREKAGQG
ncbi:XylR N-terminal domain-containing protein [Fertoebacter nigrum]|uniref:XylR N-terminal domain-containing protein n=1 Tax=Fertoeibacter niger TaxID=2656921 RepID=A0A8X8KSF8_9RHOB|nr:XylR N-terminal domain-containing protein [Fertoeibacter niger]NUB46432.1 XylR N-terminal domain-containing protein [Fertoeibacter niger]